MQTIINSEAFQIAILTSIATLIISWGSAYLNYWLQDRREKHVRDREARMHSFVTIMGLKRVISQLYVSKFEAHIFSDYHERRWQLAGYPTDSFDFQEAVRWMHKSEDYVLEIAKVERELFGAIGTARVLFPKSPDLIRLVSAVYNHENPILVSNGKEITTAKALEDWKTNAVRQVQDIVDKCISAPIEDLVNHLANHVD